MDAGGASRRAGSEHFADGFEQAPDIRGMDVADVADAECVGLGDLARVDDVSLRFEFFVEVAEVECGRRIEKRGDDAALHVVGQQGPEAQSAHALGQQPVVLRIAAVAGRYAPFLAQLLQRLAEGVHDVRGRRETPFAAPLLHGLPLGAEIERKRACVAAGGSQFLFAGDDESESGNSLNALVGAADEVVDTQFFDVDGNASEAAHRVHDEGDVPPAEHVGHFVDAVQQTGRGFAVHHRKMRRIGGFGQCLQGGGARYGFGLPQRHELIVDAVVIGDPGHPFSVGAVGEDEQFVVRAYRGADGRLHAVGAAALQQYGRVPVLVEPGDLQQTAADRHDDPFVVVFVPCAPVLHHGFADGLRGAQRPRSEQQIVSFHGMSVFVICRGVRSGFRCRRAGRLWNPARNARLRRACAAGPLPSCGSVLRRRAGCIPFRSAPSRCCPR